MIYINFYMMYLFSTTDIIGNKNIEDLIPETEAFSLEKAIVRVL